MADMDADNTAKNGAKTDRDERGRFVPGNRASLGRGRPSVEVSTRIRTALELAVSNGSLEKWASEVKKRVEKGDLDAAGFVFDRILGKPVQMVDLAADVDVKLYQTWSPDEWPD